MINLSPYWFDHRPITTILSTLIPFLYHPPPIYPPLSTHTTPIVIYHLSTGLNSIRLFVEDLTNIVEDATNNYRVAVLSSATALK